MTGSRHTYTATLVAAGAEHPLRIRPAGQITLDESTAPHVTAELELGLPDKALQQLLDPRTPARVRLDVAATFATITQTRTFDLCLRRRPIRRGRDAHATVLLASDEALLDDYRAPVDDAAPYQRQDSVRALVTYVLGRAIPGATLQPGADQPIRALIAAVNRARNPRVGSATTDWNVTWSAGGLSASRQTSGGPTADAPTFYRATSSGATTGGYIYYDEAQLPVTAGVEQLMSVWVRRGSGTVSLTGFLQDGTGTAVAQVPTVTATPAGAWVLLTARFTPPAGVVKMRPRIVIDGTLSSGQTVDATALRVSDATVDPTDVAPFDGDKPDTAEYAYGWSGAAHASTSTRTPLIDRAADMLLWRAGDSALEYLHPIVQALGLRLVCDELRRWTLRDGAYTTGETLTLVEGLNVIDADDVIDRDAGTWFDAQATIYEWTDAAGRRQRRVDWFALTATPARVNRLAIAAPYPGPGRSEYAVRRAQGRGREVTVTAVADWRTSAEQPVQAVLVDAPLQAGATSRVRFDLALDRMTITTRTTDVPAGAITLLTGTIDDLPGTIDAL